MAIEITHIMEILIIIAALCDAGMAAEMIKQNLEEVQLDLQHQALATALRNRRFAFLSNLSSANFLVSFII